MQLNAILCLFYTHQGLKRLREHAGFALFVNEIALMMRRNNPEIPDEEVQRVSVTEVCIVDNLMSMRSQL